MNNPFLAGYERDTASGLDYASARMYNNGRGRFMQPDPMGLRSADLRRPLTMNRYSYVQNDPVNLVDPNGTDSIYWECVTIGRFVWNDRWWKVESCSPYELSARDPYGSSGGTGDGGGRGGAQLQYLELPGNLKDLFKTLLATGDCADYTKKVIQTVAQATNNVAYSTSALDLFETVEGQRGFTLRQPGTGASTVTGSIVDGNAGVLLSPYRGSPGSPRVNYMYTETALHELIHLAGTTGNYTDRQLAEAVVAIGGLSDKDKEVLSNFDTTKNPGASDFFDYMLEKHCPGKAGKTLP